MKMHKVASDKELYDYDDPMFGDNDFSFKPPPAK